ncbi:MAG TPA: CoA-binding protein [Chloroflexi bacterium]|nr:CoA-binding protein [Chloroflexota bacterium]
MDKIFYPESVAIIGVSERPDNLAANIVGNTLAFGYEGALYAVGRREGRVHGVPILPSVEALPEGVDLAVILTPAATTPDLLEACGRKSIRRAVIESGGFAEFSEAGGALEEQIVQVARRWGVRFVGPNCISVVNMENGLCLPFARLDASAIKRGAVSVLAQSGGVSVTYMMLLSEAGLGVNKVVSMGNKTDLDELDYLAYLLADDGTEIVCLYLESIERGRELLELAASSPKPVIIHKANVTEASEQIAFSHTAALANDERIVSAALRQAGILRAADFDDAVALAQGLTLPPVRGNDMVVISRSGGHAVLAADAAAAQGFRLAPIPESVRDDVRGLFRADVIALTNPLDLGAIFDFELYGEIVETCLRVIDPDALLLLHTFSAGHEGAMSRRLFGRVKALSQAYGKPAAFCAFSHRSEVERIKQMAPYPVFSGIEAAVRALAASRDYHICPAQLRPLPDTPAQLQRPPEVDGILSYDGTLTSDAALGVANLFGIPVAEWSVVERVDGALVAAAAIGYPVALKALSPDLVHKSDAGGVILDVDGPERLRKAFASLVTMAQAGGVRLNGVLVQRMVFGGQEVILGGKRDPSFGPVVMFGLGGVYVEAFDDVAFRLAPLTREAARSMVAEVRGSRLLHGMRGGRPLDVDALIDALLAFSQLMVNCPEVIEIDLNPLFVLEEGVSAVDARLVTD